MREISYGSILEFDYVNWKGVRGHRKVEVRKFYYGSTDYHPDEQWLIEAWDINKGEMRIFAAKDMSNVVRFN